MKALYNRGIREQGRKCHAILAAFSSKLACLTNKLTMTDWNVDVEFHDSTVGHT